MKLNVMNKWNDCGCGIMLSGVEKLSYFIVRSHDCIHNWIWLLIYWKMVQCIIRTISIFLIIIWSFLDEQTFFSFIFGGIKQFLPNYIRSDEKIEQLKVIHNLF